MSRIIKCESTSRFLCGLMGKNDMKQVTYWIRERERGGLREGGREWIMRRAVRGKKIKRK